MIQQTLNLRKKWSKWSHMHNTLDWPMVNILIIDHLSIVHQTTMTIMNLFNQQFFNGQELFCIIMGCMPQDFFKITKENYNYHKVKRLGIWHHYIGMSFSMSFISILLLEFFIWFGVIMYHLIGCNLIFFCFWWLIKLIKRF